MLGELGLNWEKQAVDWKLFLARLQSPCQLVRKRARGRDEEDGGVFTHTRMLPEILENAHLLFFIFLSQSVIFLDVLFSRLTVSTLSLMFERSAFKAFTRKAFSRRFYPKRLTISTFCQKTEEQNNISLSVQ